MELKLNKNKIFAETGIKIMKDINYLFCMTDRLDFLLSHNKNYTKTQYQLLTEIKSILNNIEIE